MSILVAVVEVDMGVETDAGIVTEMEVLAQIGTSMGEIAHVRTEDTSPSSILCNEKIVI